MPRQKYKNVKQIRTNKYEERIEITTVKGCGKRKLLNCYLWLISNEGSHRTKRGKKSTLRNYTS